MNLKPKALRKTRPQEGGKTCDTPGCEKPAAVRAMVYGGTQHLCVQHRHAMLTYFSGEQAATFPDEEVI